MKKFIFALYILITGMVLSFSQNEAKAEPADPTPIEFKQPDGTFVTIKLKGDEKMSWAETPDGYTLLCNDKGGWEYAIKDKAGNLKISGVLAHKVGQRTSVEVGLLKRLEKKAQYSLAQTNSLKQAWESKHRSRELEGTGSFFKTGGKKTLDKNGLKSAEVFTPSGVKKLLMILIQYQDVKFTKTQADFAGLMNTPGYTGNGAHGSVRDYFLEASYGNFDLTTTVAPHIYTAAHNMAYYGADVDGDHSPKADELMAEAVLAADADGIDFSQYDNDGDGSVDGIYVVFAGYSQATGGSTDAIWPHAGTISPALTCDGKTVSKYSCSNELTGGSGTNITTIGVICHEFGHVCGAPDYYDTDYGTDGEFDGTGGWDVMDVGLYCGSPSGSRPAHFNPFEKIRAGWVTPTLLTNATSLTIPDITTNPVVYQYNTSTDDEYFLMENRQQSGFNTDIPGHGLMIYHYSKSIWSVSRNKTSPQGFYPVCASSTTNPTTSSNATSYGNISTAGCPFPGTSAKNSFTDETTPSAKSWAGNNSFKPITGITEDNTAKTVSLTFMGGNSCTPPTSQVTNLTISNIQENELTLNWTRGNGDKVIVLARRNSEVKTTPLNGTAFNANSSFGAGDLIDASTYVVYNGTGSGVTITDLLKNSTYYFAVFEYNTTNNCYLEPALTGSATTPGCSACIPTATAKGSFGITNVSFNTINNTSNYSESAYTNYAETITNVIAGSTYTLTVSTYSYSDQSVYTKAWIDWNNDCTFQSSEEYDLGSNVNEGVVTKQILVPANAHSGFVTMRIRTKYNSVPTSCNEMSNSEAEDYTLKVVGGCTPPTAQATNFTATDVQKDQITINWTRGNGDKVLVIARSGSSVDCNLIGATDFTANADFGSGAQIETGNYVVYNGTGNNITVTGLMQNTAYYFAVCEFNSPTNCILLPALTGSASTTGCSACVPSSTNNLSYGIKNVSFNTISNLTTAKELYTDYSNIFTEVMPGNSYNLAITTSSATYATYTKAWIDWNKDCVFQSSEEYNLGSSTGEATVSLSIPIPANAFSGYVKMRVRTNLNSVPTACGINGYSETEDYSLKVTGGCTPPTIQATSFTATSIQNNQATINWVRGNGENVLVIARQGAAVDSYPIGVSDFTANALFGSGAQIGTGNYAVYNGTGTSVAVTGLSPGLTYHFAVYEYNASNCILTPALTGNVTTIDEAIWTGATSTDWFTATNWNTGALPTVTTSITIPSAPANQPLISASGAVCKNITIDNGATLTMSGTTTYTLSVNGDWINNGSFTRGIGVVSFDNQTIDQTIGGSAQTNFYVLKVNKGSISRILETTAGITLNAASSNLILTAGVLKISSNSTITPLTSTYLNINGSSGIWNNGGTINPTGKQCNVTGLFRNTLGTANFSFLLASGATNSITIEGGTVNVTGYFTASPTIYTQTGGTFNVSSTSTASIPFNINTASTFNMSGGVISIQKASSLFTEYQNLAGTSAVTGGTLQIGNASTTGSPIIQINSTAPIWNLTVNATGTPIAQLETNPFTIKGDITISSLTMLNANNLNLSLAGNWTNNGTFTSGTGTVIFNGTTGQSLTGSAANTFNNLTVDNASGVTVSASALTTVNGTLLINNGKKLTIGSDSKLTVTTLTNNSDAAGLIIKSDASGSGSLIATSVSGQATAESYLTENKWHNVSPIASGGTVSGFIQNSGNEIPLKDVSYGMMSYNEAGNAWNSYYTAATADNLNAAQGYSLRRSTNGIVTYVGAISAGSKTISLTNTGEGWNCIGNPYTSAIKLNDAADAANNFLTTNATSLDASYACIYVWDDSYKGYKILGNSPAAITERILDQNIFQSGQGFFVKAKAGAAQITFNPAMQIHLTDMSFKSGNISWPDFELTASLDKIKASTLVAFNSRMTKGLDPTYDAGLLRGSSGLELYTRLVDDNGVDFAVQCLPDNDFSKLVIPVGIDSKTGGSVVFSANVKNLPLGCSVILEDKLTNKFTDLTSSSYQTSVEAGSTGHSRFQIHTSYLTTGLNEGGFNGSRTLMAYAVGNTEIRIQGSVSAGAIATLFDNLGRVILTSNLEQSDINIIHSQALKTGIYMLSVNDSGVVKGFKLLIKE